MRVLVCGSRTWTDWQFIWSVLDGLYAEAAVGWELVTLEPFVVIEGGAAGADKIARNWVYNSPLHGPLVGSSEDNGRCMPVKSEQYPAEWSKYGKLAGQFRNRKMLNEGKPDIVTAFWDGQSRGTANMFLIASAARVPTYVITKP